MAAVWAWTHGHPIHWGFALAMSGKTLPLRLKSTRLSFFTKKLAQFAEIASRSAV